MRIEKFLSYVRKIDVRKAIYLLSNPVVNGGLEIWFQVEMASQTYQDMKNYMVIREVTYPYDSQRCDLYYINQGQPEEAYIELKCMNPFNPKRCIGNFINDVNKSLTLQNNLSKSATKHNTNITILCMLIFYGNESEAKKQITEGIHKTYGFGTPLANSILSKVKMEKFSPYENLILIYYGVTCFSS